MKIINFLKARFRKFLNEEIWLEDYIAMGMKVGEKCSIQTGLVVDYQNCWLIEIGYDVTIAPYVYLLAHDASTNKHLKYTKLGRIVLEDHCFIGARSIIMPGVIVGKNAIVAAGSVVVKNVEPNTVVGGNPAKYICSLEEFITKQNLTMESAPIYDQSFTLRKNISDEKKRKMNEELKYKFGYRHL